MELAIPAKKFDYLVFHCCFCYMKSVSGNVMTIWGNARMYMLSYVEVPFWFLFCELRNWACTKGTGKVKKYKFMLRFLLVVSFL